MIELVPMAFSDATIIYRRFADGRRQWGVTPPYLVFAAAHWLTAKSGHVIFDLTASSSCTLQRIHTIQRIIMCYAGC